MAYFTAEGSSLKNQIALTYWYLRWKSQFLICIAENDDQREPETKNVLKDTFALAKLPAEIEVYKAGHGWCPPDTRVYNQELSEKAWERLLVLFKNALS